MYYKLELAMIVKIIIIIISMAVPVISMIPAHLLFLGFGIVVCLYDFRSLRGIYILADFFGGTIYKYYFYLPFLNNIFQCLFCGSIWKNKIIFFVNIIISILKQIP